MNELTQLLRTITESMLVAVCLSSLSYLIYSNSKKQNKKTVENYFCVKYSVWYKAAFFVGGLLFAIAVLLMTVYHNETVTIGVYIGFLSASVVCMAVYLYLLFWHIDIELNMITLYRLFRFKKIYYFSDIEKTILNIDNGPIACCEYKVYTRLNQKDEKIFTINSLMTGFTSFISMMKKYGVQLDDVAMYNMFIQKKGL